MSALLDEIVAWAERRDDIRVVLLTGSHARGEADRHSDLDVELFTTRPEHYAGREWMAEIRPVWAQLGFEPGPDRPTRNRLTIFAGGEKVDFLVYELAWLRESADRGRLDALHERGYRVLLDRDGLAARLPLPSGRPPLPPPPTPDELLAVVEEFWFEAWHIPKYLDRGELWVVKLRDWTMKELLLRMLEWEAATRLDGPLDVWHIGTRIASWATEDEWRRLQEVFGRFDADDARRALLATTLLFADVSAAVAERIGATIPAELATELPAYVAGATGA